MCQSTDLDVNLEVSVSYLERSTFLRLHEVRGEETWIVRL